MSAVPAPCPSPVPLHMSDRVGLDIGGSHSGAVTGAMNTAGQLGGFFCTLVFGYVVKYFDSYNAPLIGISGMLILAAVLFSRIDATKPLFPHD